MIWPGLVSFGVGLFTVIEELIPLLKRTQQDLDAIFGFGVQSFQVLNLLF